MIERTFVRGSPRLEADLDSFRSELKLLRDDPTVSDVVLATSRAGDTVTVRVFPVLRRAGPSPVASAPLTSVEAWSEW